MSQSVPEKISPAPANAGPDGMASKTDDYAKVNKAPSIKPKPGRHNFIFPDNPCFLFPLGSF